MTGLYCGVSGNYRGNYKTDQSPAPADLIKLSPLFPIILEKNCSQDWHFVDLVTLVTEVSFVTLASMMTLLTLETKLTLVNLVIMVTLIVNSSD